MCSGVPPPTLSYFNDDIVIDKTVFQERDIVSTHRIVKLLRTAVVQAFCKIGIRIGSSYWPSISTESHLNVDVDDMIAWVSDAVTYKVSNTEAKYPYHKEINNDGEMITEDMR
jgi:hypothetical protein